jgi:hypothetical protein
MKIANCAARQSVKELADFKGNNTYGEWIGEVYAVFSYGPHWPLFVNKAGVWYENEDKYGTTTSKHRSQLHPHENTIKVTKDEIVFMVESAEI